MQDQFIDCIIFQYHNQVIQELININVINLYLLMHFLTIYQEEIIKISNILFLHLNYKNINWYHSKIILIYLLQNIKLLSFQHLFIMNI